MRRLFISLALLLFVFNTGNAVVDFRVEFDGYGIWDGHTGNYYVEPRYPVNVRIYMNNNDYWLQGYSLTLAFTGDVDIAWWENGSYGPNNCLDINPDFAPDGDYFNLNNFVNFYSFDGILPDAFNHTTGGIGGWPASPD
jgi:hypothetical protein